MMNPCPRSPNFLTRGFSIVELMVALTISLIITAVLANVYSSSRATYTVDEGLARVQESGRFAMEFLSQDVRMAGYTGCLNRSVKVTNNLKVTSPPELQNYTNGKYFVGHQYTGSGGTALSDWTPALPSDFLSAGEVVAGTDVIVIRRASEVITKLNEAMLSGPAPGTPDKDAEVKILGNPGNFQKGDILILGDCRSADIFQATGPTSFGSGSGTQNNITHNTGASVPGNETQSFSKGYDETAEIMKLITRVYYVGHRDANPSTPPSLFRKELVTGAFQAQELVEGIERMYVLFGEDTDNDKVANQYRRASSVANFANVVAARVGLLVRTPDPIDKPDTTVHQVAGISVGPLNDRYRRRPFTTTIQIRNP